MASEIDKYANKAYEILYGHSTVGDITKVDAKDVPDHDLLVGGFPCQSFSVAGKRLGFADTRGTLFFEVARIAKVKQPKAMLLENVKGLISHDKGRTLDTIIQTLHDIGYTVDFNVLNSKYFGVPQNRERIFIVAIRNDLIEPEKWDIGKRKDVVAKGKRRISELGVRTFNFDWPPQTEVTTRLRDILEDKVDEKYYLSEEKTVKLVAQLSEKYRAKTEDFMVDNQGRSKKVLHPLEISPTLRGETHGNEPRVVQLDKDEPSILQKGRGFNKGGQHKIAPPLTSHSYEQNNLLNVPQMLGHAEPIEEVRPVLTPDRENKRQNGRRFKDDGEESFTLTAQDKHGIAIGKYPKYRIRKLTPRECFRLQGFPDSEFDKLVDGGISNSQLYKMAGNAVTVNVIEAIGSRLMPYLLP